MTRKELIEKLQELDACSDGLRWVRETRGTPKELWHKARYDHLGWLCDELGLQGELREKIEPLHAAHWPRQYALDEALYIARGRLEYSRFYGLKYQKKIEALKAAHAAETARLKRSYHAKCAKVIRAHVSWSDVEKALTKQNKSAKDRYDS